MPRVIHFEIPADDPARAVKFYEAVFGWKIEKWNGPMDYWLAMTGEQEQPGIDGAITRLCVIGRVVRECPVQRCGSSIECPLAVGHADAGGQHVPDFADWEAEFDCNCYFLPRYHVSEVNHERLTRSLKAKPV